MIWRAQFKLQKSQATIISPSKWAIKPRLSGNTYPVKISSINAVLRSYDVILVGRHRNAGSHHETLVTRPHGSEKEMKTYQLRAEHKRGK